MSKLAVLVVVGLAVGCGSVQTAATADGAGSAGGSAGELGGTAGAGPAGESGTAGVGAATGSVGSDAGATAGAAAGMSGAAGAAGSASAGAGGGDAAGTPGGSGGSGGAGDAKPWCEVGYPKDAPPSCESVVGAPADAVQAQFVDCPGLPMTTVPTFGTVACSKCRTPSGHGLDKCLGGWSFQRDGQACSAPTAFCVLLCSECP